MDERPTLVIAQRAVGLAVGCNPRLLMHCREAAERLEVELETVDLLSLAPAAAILRPLLILISSDLYSFDPVELDALAMTVGAGRVVVELDEPGERLRARIDEALLDAKRRRAMAAKPRQPKRRPSSGIRWLAAERRSA